jgi:hypothetical protein
VKNDVKVIREKIKKKNNLKVTAKRTGFGARPGA